WPCTTGSMRRRMDKRSGWYHPAAGRCARACTLRWMLRHEAGCTCLGVSLQHLGGAGIAAEYCQLQAMGAGLFDGTLHLFIILVADGIDEEVVFPAHLLAGALLDVGQVDAMIAEDIQHLGQGAGLVGSGEHDGRLVVAAALG